MSSRSPRSFEPGPFSTATPADYNLRPRYAHGVRLGQSARGGFYDRRDGPGPADYDVSKRAPRRKGLPTREFLSSGPREIFAPTGSGVDTCGLGQDEWALPKGFAPFGSKARNRHFWQSKRTPGPGQYDVETLRTHRRSSAPFGVRGPRAWGEGNPNPGPGAYRPEGERQFDDDESRPFGQRAPRFEKVYRDNPNAPGQYETNIRDVVHRLRAVQQPSSPFSYSGDRNPFPADPTIPGPGRYSPELGTTKSDSRKLKPCIDGSERAKPGTFIGNRISDAPGPGAYAPENTPPAMREVGGYIRRGPRSSFVRNTCAPSPERYDVEPGMLKPSLNVTYSVCKF
jgi:hypothetical protein